jgi:polar amino acid transport system substrate-binding protein
MRPAPNPGPRIPAASVRARPLTALLLVAAALLIACGMVACVDDQRAVQPAAQGDILERVLHDKRVRIGVKADTPPFGMAQGGGYVGFDIDIATALASALGIEDIVFVPVTSAERMDKIEKGEVDMLIASMSITRYRERRVDFSLPYFQDGQGLLVKHASTIGGYLDLAGRKVGTVKGSSSSYYLHQVSPDCTPVVVADFPALLALLDHDQVDAITSDQTILIGLRVNAPDPAAYRLAGTPFTVEPYGVAVPQNQSHWRNAIDRALMEICERGQWQAITDLWFGPGTKYSHRIDFHPPIYPR